MMLVRVGRAGRASASCPSPRYKIQAADFSLLIGNLLQISHMQMAPQYHLCHWRQTPNIENMLQSQDLYPLAMYVVRGKSPKPFGTSNTDRHNTRLILFYFYPLHPDGVSQSGSAAALGLHRLGSRGCSAISSVLVLFLGCYDCL